MTDQNRMAYGLTTVFLSLLPLVAVGGVGWWTFRRILQAEPDFFAERPDPVVVAESERENVAEPRLVVVPER